VNEQIQKRSKLFSKIYNKQISERSFNNSDLANQYIDLLEERNKIKKLVDEYEVLDKKQIDGNMNISQNYYSFILLLLLVILFIFILYKYSKKV
jgi:hypothetical protein